MNKEIVVLIINLYENNHFLIQTLLSLNNCFSNIKVINFNKGLDLGRFDNSIEFINLNNINEFIDIESKFRKLNNIIYIYSGYQINKENLKKILKLEVNNQSFIFNINQEIEDDNDYIEYSFGIDPLAKVYEKSNRIFHKENILNKVEYSQKESIYIKDITFMEKIPLEEKLLQIQFEIDYLKIKKLNIRKLLYIETKLIELEIERIKYFHQKNVNSYFNKISNEIRESLFKDEKEKIDKNLLSIKNTYSELYLNNLKLKENILDYNNKIFNSKEKIVNFESFYSKSIYFIFYTLNDIKTSYLLINLILIYFPFNINILSVLAKVLSKNSQHYEAIKILNYIKHIIINNLFEGIVLDTNYLSVDFINFLLSYEYLLFGDYKGTRYYLNQIKNKENYKDVFSQVEPVIEEKLIITPNLKKNPSNEFFKFDYIRNAREHLRLKNFLISEELYRNGFKINNNFYKASISADILKNSHLFENEIFLKNIFLNENKFKNISYYWLSKSIYYFYKNDPRFKEILNYSQLLEEKLLSTIKDITINIEKTQNFLKMNNMSFIQMIINNMYDDYVYFSIKNFPNIINSLEIKIKYKEIIYKTFSNIFTLQLIDEFDELLKEVDFLKPKTILEIGSAQGGTLNCFSKLSTSDCKLISIDLKHDTDFKNKVRPYSSQILYQISGNSHDKEIYNKLLKFLNGEKIDFIFFDGDHTYNGIKKDFEMYSKLLSSKGIIAFHDIQIKDNVKTFWKEISSEYKYIREIISNKNQEFWGIGIIYSENFE